MLALNISSSMLLNDILTYREWIKLIKKQIIQCDVKGIKSLLKKWLNHI